MKKNEFSFKPLTFVIRYLDVPLAYKSTHWGCGKKMAEIQYLDNPLETEGLLELLCPPVRNWFKDKFPDFTEPQKLAIPAIIEQEHLLLCSPTGSGKP